MLCFTRKDKLKQAGFLHLLFLSHDLGVLVGLLFDLLANMFCIGFLTSFLAEFCSISLILRKIVNLVRPGPGQPLSFRPFFSS